MHWIDVRQTQAELPLLTAAELKAFEQSACVQRGQPTFDLMAQAGKTAFLWLRARWPAARRWLVVVGPGNNGGDGLVIARHAMQSGLFVTIAVGHAPITQWQKKLKGDARLAWQALSPLSPQIVPLASVDWNTVDLIVDAFLGSGVKPPARDEALAVIATLNGAARPIAAIDVPSGLDADRGVPVGEAVRATETLAMIALKTGQVTSEGPDYCGRLWLAPLGLDARTASHARVRWRGCLTARWRLPARSCNSHKGCFGHVGVIGGNFGMGGAGLMAAQAALRSGAGKVTWWTHTAHVSAAMARCPELMVQTHTPDDASTFLALSQHDVVVFGPGLGRDDWAAAWSNQVRHFEGPLVVDADGLYWLDRWKALPRDLIITPHPGEAAKLLGCTVAEIQANRYDVAEQLAKRYQAVVVLKGYGTLVSDGQTTIVSPYGHPAMAVAGMGDVLAGVIGAIRAQGVASMRAAVLGVMAHGAAGEAAATRWHNGLVATDLFPQLAQFLWES